MKKVDLISNVEAHLLVSKAIDSTIESLKESPLQSIRQAAKYWEKQLIGKDGIEKEFSSTDPSGDEV